MKNIVDQNYLIEKQCKISQLNSCFWGLSFKWFYINSIELTLRCELLSSSFVKTLQITNLDFLEYLLYFEKTFSITSLEFIFNRQIQVILRKLNLTSKLSLKLGSKSRNKNVQCILELAEVGI